MATAVLLLNHVPPVVVLASVDVEPSQALNVPVIDAGLAFTVVDSLREQPVGSVYVMLLAPADAPVSIPDVEPIVATLVVPLNHVPPAGVVDSVVVMPTQMAEEAVNTAGVGLTVNVAVQ